MLPPMVIGILCLVCLVLTAVSAAAYYFWPASAPAPAPAAAAAKPPPAAPGTKAAAPPPPAAPGAKAPATTKAPPSGGGPKGTAGPSFSAPPAANPIARPPGSATIQGNEKYVNGNSVMEVQLRLPASNTCISSGNLSGTPGSCVATNNTANALRWNLWRNLTGSYRLQPVVGGPGYIGCLGRKADGDPTLVTGLDCASEQASFFMHNFDDQTATTQLRPFADSGRTSGGEDSPQCLSVDPGNQSFGLHNCDRIPSDSKNWDLRNDKIPISNAMLPKYPAVTVVFRSRVGKGSDRCLAGMSSTVPENTGDTLRIWENMCKSVVDRTRWQKIDLPDNSFLVQSTGKRCVTFPDGATKNTAAVLSTCDVTHPGQRFRLGWQNKDGSVQIMQAFSNLNWYDQGDQLRVSDVPEKEEYKSFWIQTPPS